MEIRPTWRASYGREEKPPSREELSRAGRDLQNPHTREPRESEAARTLREGRDKKKK